MRLHASRSPLGDIHAHIGDGRAVWQEPPQGGPTGIRYAGVTGKPTASKVVGGPNRGNAVPVGSYLAHGVGPHDQLTLAQRVPGRRATCGPMP